MARKKKKKNKKKISSSLAKTRTFKIENPVWSYVIFVRVGGSDEQAAKATDKLFGSNIHDDGPGLDAAGRCFLPGGEKSHVIWFKNIPGVGLLSHESFHSVHHVLQLSGLALNNETEEAYAYLLDWTVKEIGFRIWK